MQPITTAQKLTLPNISLPYWTLQHLDFDNLELNCHINKSRVSLTFTVNYLIELICTALQVLYTIITFMMHYGHLQTLLMPAWGRHRYWAYCRRLPYGQLFGLGTTLWEGPIREVYWQVGHKMEQYRCLTFKSMKEVLLAFTCADYCIQWGKKETILLKCMPYLSYWHCF